MQHLLARFARRVGALVRGRSAERDMDEEMRFHLDMEARDLVRQGVPAPAAQREARRRFGGVERYKEEGRDARGVRLVQDIAQDIRYAMRQSIEACSFRPRSMASASRHAATSIA